MLFGCHYLCDCGLKNTYVSIQKTAEGAGDDDCLEVTSEAEYEHAYASACETDQQYWFATKDIGLYFA